MTILSHFIHVQYCYTYLIDQIPLGLLSYSHLPTALLSLLFGIFILYKTKNLQGVLFFGICFTFSLWCACDFITWLAFPGSATTMFTWSILDLLAVLMFFFSYYFLYTFITKKDLRVWQKILCFLIILPTGLATFYGLNIPNYDANACTAIENQAITQYGFYALALFILATLVITVHQYRCAEDQSVKREILLAGIGVSALLIFFFSATLSVSLFATSDASAYVYNYEIYGLFGMPIFLAYFAYLIVRYKAFNLKMFGAQALILALIALVGSEFAFVSSITNQILVAITLVVIGAVGILLIRSVKREITQREELAVANAGQENLIHIMNHQIKGYLGTARNIFAELGQSDDYGVMPEASKPLLSKGLEEMAAGVDYVQGILRSNSAQSGAMPYTFAAIDLKKIVDDLVAKQKEVAEKAGLTFESKIADGDYAMQGDATMLEEAFKNLITNAIKYNSPSGSVSVSLSRADKKVLFSVRDTGIGISADDAKRLFTAGGVGKDSIHYNVEASGFGLSFVKPVVEKHQGRVWYKSNAPEKGTTFFIELPVS